MALLGMCCFYVAEYAPKSTITLATEDVLSHFQKVNIHWQHFQFIPKYKKNDDIHPNLFRRIAHTTAKGESIKTLSYAIYDLLTLSLY